MSEKGATPVKKRDGFLKRKSLVDSTVNMNSSLISEAQSNDDVLEKAERTKRRFVEKTVAYSSPSGLKKTDNVKSAEELAAFYANCVKSINEKKINQKNAFDFQLIEFLKDVANQDGTVDIIQFAAGSLDASATIYSYRVDSVHQETIKMAGSITQGPTKTKDKDGEICDPNCDDDSNNNEPKRKKNRRKGATLEKNPKNLDDNSIPDFLDISSCHRISSIFNDKNSGDNYLANTLEFVDDSLCFLLDDAHTELPECQFTADKCTVWEVISNNPTFKESKICAAFDNFRFSDWSIDDADEYSRNEEFNNSHVLDFNNMDYESNGLGEGDCLNYSVHDPIQNPIIVGKGLCGGGAQALFSDLEQNPLDLFSMLSENPTEYSFFDEKYLSWNHNLKKKRANRMKGLEDSKNTEERKEKRSKKALDVYIETFEMDEEKLKALFQCKPASKFTLPPSVVRKWSSKSTTFPVMTHEALKNVTRFFLRPNIMIKRSNKVAVVNEDDVEAYDYGNLNDSQNYCPEGDGDEQVDQEPFLDLDDNLYGEDGDQLLSCPQQLERLSIKYETSAKKMDMRKLKMAIWSILTKNSPDDRVHEPVKFSGLYESLHSELTGSMQENLTVSLVAVALLHLANDKNLCIETEGFTDDNIELTSQTTDATISQG